MSNPRAYELEYLFRAEAKNGTIIKQTPDDTSKVNPEKSAFYDVLHNLPLKTFSLVGNGHVFTVDFEKFQILIDGGVNQAPVPPEGSRVTPIYYRDVIQVAKNTLQRDSTLISKLIRWECETTLLVPHVQFHIGFQIRLPNGRNRKFEMTVF